MRYILILLLCIPAFHIQAQVSNEKEPRSWSVTQKDNLSIDPIILPAIEQEILSNQTNGDSSLNKMLLVGKDVSTTLNLYNSGSWKVLPNGDRLWRLNVISKNAKFTRAIFDTYYLPEGSELYLYNDTKTDWIGPYTSNENQEDGILGTWMVQGDNLWIEYYEPKRNRGLGRIGISSITHGLIDLSPEEKSIEKLNESGACNVDVLCNPNTNSSGNKDWTQIRDENINAVARILIPRGNQTFLCTGAMIGNTSNDATPYFLTANHCLGTTDGAGSSFNASAWSFGFQWFTQTPQCATFSNTQGPANPVRVLSGAQLKANNDDTDFALFLLNQSPPEAWNLYYSGWDRTGAVPQEQLGLHHPSGDIMKLARNDQSVNAVALNFNGNTQTRTWRVADWDYGVTEGGSSGSFLLNEDGLIVGQLAGGFAACNGTNDNNLEDFYGRFDVSWNSGNSSALRLRDWLDPQNTGDAKQAGGYFETLSSTVVDGNDLGIKIYPNPNNGIFKVETDLVLKYEIFNIRGQKVVAQKTLNKNSQIDISGTAQGVYFIKLITQNGISTEKFIVK